MLRSAVAIPGTGSICVAILRCSVAPLLGVAPLRLRCSLLSRVGSLALVGQLDPVPPPASGPLPASVASTPSERRSGQGDRACAVRRERARGLDHGVDVAVESVSAPQL